MPSAASVPSHENDVSRGDDPASQAISGQELRVQRGWRLFRLKVVDHSKLGGAIRRLDP